MQGNRDAAMEVSRKVAAKARQDRAGYDWGLYQTFLSMPLFAMVRFGQWEAILAESAPPEKQRYWTGIWHYARGMAYTHTNRLDQASQELRVLDALADDPDISRENIGMNNTATLLTIATEVLSGELAAKQTRFPAAISHLERAVRLEDSLIYNEPPDWYFPVRHILGAVLLEAGYPAEAEVVYWQDLKRYRENGYSLYGLRQSYQARNETAMADQVSERFEKAWAGADVNLSSSRY